MRIPSLVLVLLVLLSVNAETHNGMVALFTDSTLMDCDENIKPFEVVDIYLYYLRGYGPELGPCWEFKLLNSSPDVIVINPDWPPNTLPYGDVTEKGVSVCPNADGIRCYNGLDAVYLGTVPIMNIGDKDTFTISVVDHRLAEAINILACDVTTVHRCIGDMFVFNGKHNPIENPTPPRILEASTNNSACITLILNEEVTAGTAENIANYEIFVSGNPGAPVQISDAVLAEGGNEVVLTVSSLFVEDESYTLRADGVEDLEGYDIRAGTIGSEITFVAGDYTATLLSSFHASLKEGYIEIGWRLSEVSDGAEFYVLRAGVPGGDVRALPGAGIVREGLSYTYRDDGCEPGATYVYRVDVMDGEGRRLLFETKGIEVPAVSLALYQNNPNPFNPATAIAYHIPSPCRVKLDIYDISGRRIMSLVDRNQAAGSYEVGWDGRDTYGNSVTSGVYFYRLTAGKETMSRKMVLLH